MSTTRVNRQELFQKKPAWAVAALIAEEHIDDSDILTDYHNHKTGRTVFLGWSKHERDVFSEMRQAAARFTDTAHLGPGKNIVTARVVIAAPESVRGNGAYYHAGQPSHWHQEIEPEGGFLTRAEAEAFVTTAPEPHASMFDETCVTFKWEITERSVEHREKYSMGDGYYLKAGFSDGDGWAVKKRGGWWLKALSTETGEIEVATVPLTTAERKTLSAALRAGHAKKRAAKAQALANPSAVRRGRPRKVAHTPPTTEPVVVRLGQDVEIVPGVVLRLNRAQVVQTIERLVNVLA